jgi:hypothetical protein
MFLAPTMSFSRHTMVSFTYCSIATQFGTRLLDKLVIHFGTRLRASSALNQGVDLCGTTSKQVDLLLLEVVAS